MTTKPVTPPPDSGRLPPLPDPPRKWDKLEEELRQLRGQ